MKYLLISTLLITTLLSLSCVGKSQYKNLAELREGDTMEFATVKWGEPDYINKSTWKDIEREQWVYTFL
ncbi:MAG: hypothetical protein GWO07_04205 [Candidatus Dadabacteria bacterium]|nr:hypothetical protein [Candidatus Dadabacteria bacterium]NIS07967.1 hypothetical protein [Candidatus Dadabacteria bacterium]NIV43088.1 hypothetical protein [Candidatus Dadabacteria bacterium]NIX14924.1 hypothetical protein [Candidatus Dadabacteria bacterium]NIY21551.1 hypothetical protein [Candidatus Dadabacteria bacterium]